MTPGSIAGSIAGQKWAKENASQGELRQLAAWRDEAGDVEAILIEHEGVDFDLAERFAMWVFYGPEEQPEWHYRDDFEEDAYAYSYAFDVAAIDELVAASLAVALDLLVSIGRGDVRHVVVGRHAPWADRAPGDRR